MSPSDLLADLDFERDKLSNQEAYLMFGFQPTIRSNFHQVSYVDADIRDLSIGFHTYRVPSQLFCSTVYRVIPSSDGSSPNVLWCRYALTNIFVGPIARYIPCVASYISYVIASPHGPSHPPRAFQSAHPSCMLCRTLFMGSWREVFHSLCFSPLLHSLHRRH